MTNNSDSVRRYVGSLKDLEGRLRAEVVTSPAADQARSILSALEQFSEIVRYLNTRRTTGVLFKLESEGDVQDALYVMLRGWVQDLQYESPTEKAANQHKLLDFAASSARLGIEAKFVRSRDHGKHIFNEIAEDIECYRRLPWLDCLCFFVYDPEFHIPDHLALKREIEIERSYGTRKLVCKLVYKP